MHKDLEAAKAAAVDAIDAMRTALIALSRDIHAHPELAFAEHHAARVLTEALEAQGLPVEREAYGLGTAFCSEFGEPEGPVVALLAEYDALPGIGHACGHNLIATASLGAALALGRARDTLPGRIRLLGTPAEERGAGKEIMARRGAFDGVAAAMMIHPAGVNLSTMPCICVAEVEVLYSGRAAHASAAPHSGVNALDGLVLAYQAIAALRQHIRHTERIHGVITDGGQAPNIVPERAAGTFYVRAKNVRQLDALKVRVEACFAAGAAASGASVETRWADIDYPDLNT
ncbi:MAG: amidohydrolase [bacterium]